MMRSQIVSAVSWLKLDGLAMSLLWPKCKAREELQLFKTRFVISQPFYFRLGEFRTGGEKFRIAVDEMRIEFHFLFICG